MSNREPNDLCIACHNSEVNRASRSEMMEVGTPCLETTSLRYTSARVENLSVSLIARKCADFVSRSTITHIVSFPRWDLGRPVTKSMEISSHFHCGILGCWSRPAGF
ncbi:hypothetical protein Hanom_Chr16g01466411 [Helianthus anomalus]